MSNMNADVEYNESIYNGIKDIQRIPELDWKNTFEYNEATPEEVLYPLIDKHDAILICGAYFGDEGKGKTVDAVSHHPKISLVARTNSGENAGHTVYYQGKKFVFHLCPSGLMKGKTNLIGPECVMDPVSFMETEIQPLIEAGIPYKDKLFIGNVHIVTPYHKLLDFITSGSNASTLKGMAPVHASKSLKRGIRLDHLFNDREACARRLKRDLEAYTNLLKATGLTEEALAKSCEEMNADGNIRIPIHVSKFVTSEDKIKYLFDLYDTYVCNNPDFPKREDVTYTIRKALERGQKVLLEGPQSYWLSNASEKFWESSTSADTGAHGLVATARFNLQNYKSLVINIHKTPASSRIGVGANPSSYVAQDYFSRQNIITLKQLGSACQDFQTIQKKFFEAVQPNGIIKPTIYEENGISYGIGVAMAIASALKHGECGATTKKPRVVGFFDCVMQYEMNQIQGPYLSISAVDRGDDYDFVGITIAYVYYNPKGTLGNCNGRVYQNGDVIKAGDPVPTEQVMYFCHPVVMLINGWRDQPIAASLRKPGSPIPKGVQDLLGAIEHFTGSVILSIGNGPNDCDFIYIKRRS